MRPIGLLATEPLILKRLESTHRLKRFAAVPLSPSAAARLRRWRVLLALPILYLVALALLMLFENKLIFIPLKHPAGN